MKKDEINYTDLLKLILPTELFKYFDVVRVHSANDTIDVYLDEKPVKPTNYNERDLESKGFHASATIRDFPIREKAVFLHVRRRRWLVKSTSQVISNKWDTVEQGTQYTKGFASFLKELHDYRI